MDAMFDICYLSSDGNNVEPDDIPKTKDNVWILGKKYSSIQGRLQNLSFTALEIVSIFNIIFDTKLFINNSQMEKQDDD